MKINKALLLYSIGFVMVCGCEGCDNDSNYNTVGKKDASTSYLVNEGAYGCGRRDIEVCITKIFKDLKKEDIVDRLCTNKGLIVPFEKEFEREWIGKLYTNNLIVLESYFLSVFAQTVYLNILIGKIKEENLSKEYKKCLGDYKTELSTICEKILSKNRDKINPKNQAIYKHIFELENAFATKVLLLILPKIITEQAKQEELKNLKELKELIERIEQNLEKLTEQAKQEELKDQIKLEKLTAPVLFGVTPIILKTVIANPSEAINDYVKGLMDEIKSQKK